MEQNNRNRRSYSNEENFGSNESRYNQDYGNNRFNNDNDDLNRNSSQNYGSNRGNYDQGYDDNSMRNSRNQDRWNEDSNFNNNRSNYGRSGSSSDWDFNGQRNPNRNFDNFGSGNYGQGDAYNNRNEGRDQRNFGLGQSDFGQSSRSGSQDYGRNNYSQDYGRNRNYRNNDNRGQGQEDRGWWDRTKDEVSSWFGDDDAQHRRERDDRMMGQHRGKGPKNYQRSTERIKEDINDRLSDAHDLDASEIEVKVDGSEATLSGTVTSRDQKRRAEDVAESVSGVTHVQNNLRVNQQNSWNDSSNTGSTSGSSLTGTNATTGSTTTGVTGSGSGMQSSTGAGAKDMSATSGGSTANQVKPEKNNAN